METLTLLLQGFVQCFTLERMLACAGGVLVGTLTGVLPGIGVTGAMALLLPISFGMDATSALILFAGIYYGAISSLKTDFKELDNLAIDQCSLLRMKAQNGLLCLDPQMAVAGEIFFLWYSKHPFV